MMVSLNSPVLSLQAKRGVPTMGATADAKAHMDSPTPVTAPRVDCWKDVNTVISTPTCRVPHTHTHTHVYATYLANLYAYLLLR